jgi:flavodoxin
MVLQARGRMRNILIVYYSFSTNTQKLAIEIARQTGGDIRELIPQKTYSFNYNTATKEARSEILRGFCPELKSGNEPIDNYDTVFLGTPNWFKSLTPPVLTFLRKHDFSPKTLIPFCTHGGGGFGEIEKQIAKECLNSRLLPGIAVNGSASVGQISAWLSEIGLLS